jgi:hypothetical protein
MKFHNLVVTGVISALLLTGSMAVAQGKKGTRVSPQGLINKYGFDSWNLESSKCRVISKAMIRRFRSCVNQGTRKTAEGRFTQFKCKKADKSEVLIYHSRNVCARQYHSMYLEGF